jgi:signal transduction histidine kinase
MASRSKRRAQWWRRPFAALRLRHKLALSLSIAALLPVIVASWVAVSVVLRGLDQGLRDDTDRQLRVGLNLTLRNVEAMGHNAVRLASAGDLSRAMEVGKIEVAQFLSSAAPHLPSSLVQIADERGAIVAERVVGGETERFKGLGVTPDSADVQSGLGFEQKVTLFSHGDLLLVRAVAPIVDESYMLQGVVIVTVPLDGAFADGVKSALGAEVLIVAAPNPKKPTLSPLAMSTFLDPQTGEREQAIVIEPSVARRVASGETVMTSATVLHRQYSVGYTPLMSLEGDIVGTFGVAVDRAPLVHAKAAAMRSLVLGAAGAFVFALGLAGLLSRRITRPIARLHRGAVAIARGDLDQRIEVAEGDEIGDLAEAFSHMTKALKENQRRLAARMREIVALHDAGRAISSVIDQKAVLRKIVDSVARVFDVRLCALWLVEGDGSGDAIELRLGAARAKLDVRHTLRGSEGADIAEPLQGIAKEVAVARATLRVDRVAEDPDRCDAALGAGITGSLLATPLERKGQVVGVIIVGRTSETRPFSEASSNLLATFADQAATAVENARLYEEVRAFNEELEAKVRLRTTELTAMNSELGRTIRELKETQSQLILSERLAGLGLLVAGVAHEINSPSAAIRGSTDALGDNVERLTALSLQLGALELSPEEGAALTGLVAKIGPELAAKRRISPAQVRRNRRGMCAELADIGVDEEVADNCARRLAEIGVDPETLASLLQFIDSDGVRDRRAGVVTRYLTEYVYLHRNSLTILKAIKRIQRIVGALKTYSHLDQDARLSKVDITEGIEDTLVLLDYVLRGITITRNYGETPPVPVYVDELNQVWTNLLQNAVQAMGGEGSITMETDTGDDGVIVRIIDNGPGIPADVLPSIFDPFFTTKAKGEGTGLGLGIVRQIVEKHHGRVKCDSEPGRTCFEVWLPLRQPAEKRDKDPRDEPGDAERVEGVSA